VYRGNALKTFFLVKTHLLTL